MHSSSYEQALAFWYRCINYELNTPAASDLRLDRMRHLLRLLGDPHGRCRIIHIAGSKGKGSTAAMLAAILGQAGYRTGLFTSPHLCRVEERMQVDGVPISAEELTVLLNDVEQVVCSAHWAGGGIPRPVAHAIALNNHAPPGLPTFFEV